MFGYLVDFLTFIYFGKKLSVNVSVDDDSNIFVVGSGIKFPEHLTLEAISALNQCTKIFTIPRCLSGISLPFEFQSKMVNLWSLYKKDRLRKENYKAIVDVIIDEAINNPTVGYLAFGNPLVFDSVTQGLIRYSIAHDLGISVFPGVSSIDTIAVDLKKDIAPGLQIYDATMFIGLNIKPCTHVSCLLLQLGVLGTSYTVIDRKPNNKSFLVLRSRLEEFYPPDHQVFIVSSSQSNQSPTKILNCKISDIGLIDVSQCQGGSLLIPEVSPNSGDIDEVFLSKTTHVESLFSNYIPRNTD